MTTSARHERSDRPAEIVAGSAFHENLAENWTRGYERGSFQRRLGFVTPCFDRWIRAGQAWLDAGCGSGVLSRELAGRGADVVAVDASPAMLAGARSNMAPNSPPIRYDLIETVERTGLGDASFDGVLCSSVLEYVDDPVAAVREFHRLLRPGGTLILTVPNRFSAIRVAQQAVRGIGAIAGKPLFPYLGVSKHAFSAGNAATLLTANGFTVGKVTGFSPYLPRILVPAGLGALWLLIGTKTAPRPPSAS